MKTDFDKIRDQIGAVEDAADEARSNIDKLARLRPNQLPDRQEIEYLRGDAYELEQRVNRLVQNLRAASDEAEEILEPRPQPTKEERVQTFAKEATEEFGNL